MTGALSTRERPHSGCRRPRFGRLDGVGVSAR